MFSVYPLSINIFLVLCSNAHFHLRSLQGKTSAREPARAQKQSKSNYRDAMAASTLIRLSLTAVTSTPQPSVKSRSQLNPCSVIFLVRGMGREMDQMWGIITAFNPVCAPEGRRWANTALISICIPWSWRELILLAKRRRMLLLKVLLRWNIIRQCLPTDRTIRSIQSALRRPFLPENNFNLWSISRRPLCCFCSLPTSKRIWFCSSWIRQLLLWQRNTRLHYSASTSDFNTAFIVLEGLWLPLLPIRNVCCLSERFGAARLVDAQCPWDRAPFEHSGCPRSACFINVKQRKTNREWKKDLGD